MTSLSIIYYLIIIVYINSNINNLLDPVKINKMANSLHIDTISYKLSCELLVYEDYVTIKKWPLYLYDDSE